MIGAVIREVTGHIGLLLVGWKRVNASEARRCWYVGPGRIVIWTHPWVATGYGGSYCCMSSSSEERGCGEDEERDETEDVS